MSISNQNLNILVTGLTSLKLGAMETDNLGNFLIAESLFRSLRNYYNNAEIYTTLQMSDEFANRYKLIIVRGKQFWIYNKKNYLLLKFEFFLSQLWKFLTKFKLKFSFILFTERLKLLRNSDIILDFHGDIFGDNALTKYHFLTGALIPVIAQKLKKKIFFISSSPGPYNSIKKLKIAIKAFQNYEHISVREPISLNIINSIGFSGDKYTMQPCFSFGFKPYNEIEDNLLLKNEPRLKNFGNDLIGLILTTHNFKEMPLNKWPREDWEYRHFIDLLSYIVEKHNLKICIFSHRYKFDSDNKIKMGSDHSVIEKLLDLLPPDVKNKAFTLSGIYDASSMNKIIRKFKVLLSGRIHGAVQGIQQFIPTMIIDYANEPKAHKLQGFANMTYLNEYIADPNSSESLISNFEKIWNDQKIIHNKLKSHVPQLVKESEKIWEIIDNKIQ